MDAIGTGLNAHSAEADSMRIQFCTVWTGLKSVKIFFELAMDNE